LLEFIPLRLNIQNKYLGCSVQLSCFLFGSLNSCHRPVLFYNLFKKKNWKSCSVPPPLQKNARNCSAKRHNVPSLNTLILYYCGGESTLVTMETVKKISFC